MTDADDITNPRTFAIYAAFCLVFGAMIGGGFYITFATLHISADNAIAAMIIVFCAASIPAVFLRWYKGDIELKMPEIELQEDDGEDK